MFEESKKFNYGDSKNLAGFAAYPLSVWHTYWHVLLDFLQIFFLSLFLYPRLNIQCVIMRHLSCKCFKVRQLLCCVLKMECIPSGLRCCLHSAALFAQLRRQRRSLMTLGVWVLMPSLQADTFKTIRTSFRYFQMLEQSVRSWSWESPKPSTFTFNLRHQCIHAFVFAELM